MSSRGLNFSKEVKGFARDQAKEFVGDKYCHCHHIVAKEIAQKYDLDPAIVTSVFNAIVIEADYHQWIHGKHYCKADDECDWKGLTEDDYLFLYSVLCTLNE